LNGKRREAVKQRAPDVIKRSKIEREVTRKKGKKRLAVCKA